MNIGKTFEQALKQSVPDYALLYRLPDAAQSFSPSSKLRFSAKNPFDFLIWDSVSHVLYAIEAKTVSGKSISFERTNNDNGEIHMHQVKGLNKWNEYDGITCGFIIWFRGADMTIFLDIKEFNRISDVVSKKSFNIVDLDKHKIDYILIPQRKLKVNYRFDIDGFLKLQH